MTPDWWATFVSSATVVSLQLAFFSRLKAAWSKSNSSVALDSMGGKLDSLSKDMGKVLTSIVKSVAPASVEQESMFSTQTYDVTGNGASNLLIEYPAGAHGAAMKILEVGFNGMRELDELFADTSPYFEIKDFDGDGKLEIASYTRNYDGNPVRDPGVQTIHKWDGNTFSPMK